MEDYKQDLSIFEGMDEIGEEQIREVLSKFQQGRNWKTRFTTLAEFTAKYYGLNTDDIHAIQINRPPDDKDPITVKIAYDQSKTLERIDDLIADDEFYMGHLFVTEVIRHHSRLCQVPTWGDKKLQPPLKNALSWTASARDREAWVGLKRFDASFWKDMHIRHCLYSAEIMGMKIHKGSSVILKADNFKPPRVFLLSEVEVPTFESFYE